MVNLKNLKLLGYFQGGQRSGEGFFQYANKDRYSGHWRFGKKHGQGTYIIDGSQMKVDSEVLLLACWTVV